MCYNMDVKVSQYIQKVNIHLITLFFSVCKFICGYTIRYIFTSCAEVDAMISSAKSMYPWSIIFSTGRLALM